MIKRVQRWLFELLVSLDQLFHVILGGPKFIIFDGPCPNADETISSKVGRQAVKGKKWALFVEPIINILFRPLGQKNHCRDAIGS